MSADARADTEQGPGWTTLHWALSDIASLHAVVRDVDPHGEVERNLVGTTHRLSRSVVLSPGDKPPLCPRDPPRHFNTCNRSGYAERERRTGPNGPYVRRRAAETIP